MKLKFLRGLSALLAALALGVCCAVAGTDNALADQTGVYRALLIGNNNYSDADSRLDGCINDARALAAALNASTGYAYARVEVKTDLTAQGMKNALDALSGWGAGENDVTVVFYSGHGYRGANQTGIVGVDMNELSYAEIEQSLSKINGQVVVLLDCCYSGALIGKSTDAMEQINREVLSAFGLTAKTLSGSKYHVITAAGQYQLSYESQGHGFFASGLTEALGYNAYTGKKLDNLPGDEDGDGIVSVGEAYRYSSQYVYGLMGSSQSVKASQENSALMLVSRQLSGEPEPTPEPEPSEPAGTLPNLSTAILAPGQSYQLNYAGDVQWSSTKNSVATVSTSGLVTGVKTGKAIIRAQVDGKTVVRLNVAVVKSSQTVRKITLSKHELTRKVGSAYKLSVKFTPSAAYKKTVRYYSTDTSVATVSSSGVVTPKKEGQCTVYAIASSGVVDVCSVNVKPATVTRVTLNKTRLTLIPGGSATLSAKTTPSYAADRTVNWSSGNESVVRVDASTGQVTAVGEGKAYVYARSNDGGASARCLVTVEANEFYRAKMLRTSGKLRTSARRIYYSEDNTQLIIQMYYANLTGRRQTVPQAGTLYVRTAKNAAYRAVQTVTAGTTTVASGKGAIITFAVPLSGINASLAGLDLRNSDALVK